MWSRAFVAASVRPPASRLRGWLEITVFASKFGQTSGGRRTTDYVVLKMFYQWVAILDGALFLACKAASILVLQYNEAKGVVLDHVYKWLLIPDAGRRELLEHIRLDRYRLPGSE